MSVMLKSCGTALVTPFTASGEVDSAAYERAIARQTEAGMDFLVPLATTGETPTLSASEKVQLLELTRRLAPGTPLLVGVGSNSLAATLENIELLGRHGADAYLVVVPYYNKPTQEGQYEYFKAVAKASDKPIVIYNVPGRTGANMTAATAVRLAREFPNIIATKEASGNFVQVCEILAGAPDSFSVLSGDDDMTFALMAAGAAGVISVASNLAPAEVKAMTDAMLAGNLAKARELHFRLLPLFRACFVESNPIPVKAALSQLGVMGDYTRLPLSRAAESTHALMSDIISSLWK